MKHFKKLYPTYYRSLFVFYSSKEKKSIVLLFFVILANVHLLFWGLPQSPTGFLWGLPITLTIFILAKLAVNNSRSYNKRVLKELYGIEIDEYTKAFSVKFRRILFLKNLADSYARYEDLLADYDDDDKPLKLNIKANFIKLLLYVFAAIGFIGTFLFDGAPLQTKIAFLAFITAFVVLIIIIYFQFSPIVKEILNERYKRDRIILYNIEEIKNTLCQLPPRYVAANDLKTLILNADLIDESFRPFFLTSPVNGGISTLNPGSPWIS